MTMLKQCAGASEAGSYLNLQLVEHYSEFQLIISLCGSNEQLFSVEKLLKKKKKPCG